MSDLVDHGEISRALDSVSPEVLREMADAIWASTRRHPPTASCECPAIEALKVINRYPRPLDPEVAEVVAETIERWER